jgi:hypothetical protein
LYLSHLLNQTFLGSFQIIGSLKVHPVGRSLAKCFAEQQGQLCRHWTGPLNDMENPYGRNANCLSKGILAYAELVEYFVQKYSGMYVRKAIVNRHRIFSLVVVGTTNTKQLVYASQYRSCRNKCKRRARRGLWSFEGSGMNLHRHEVAGGFGGAKGRYRGIHLGRREVPASQNITAGETTGP